MNPTRKPCSMKTKTGAPCKRAVNRANTDRCATHDSDLYRRTHQEQPAMHQEQPAMHSMKTHRAAPGFLASRPVTHAERVEIGYADTVHSLPSTYVPLGYSDDVALDAPLTATEIDSALASL